jgi:hypothetical protein
MSIIALLTKRNKISVQSITLKNIKKLSAFLAVAYKVTVFLSLYTVQIVYLGWDF